MVYIIRYTLIIILTSLSLTAHAISTREKIARMLVISFDGSNSTNSKEIFKIVDSVKIGGVILFSYNIESKDSLTKLCHEIKRRSSHPIFIAIDQEGGKVCRLKASNGFSKNLSAQRLGEINNHDTTRYYARISANEMHNIGINLNFAPTVDININPKSPIIGHYQRSFGDNATIVTNHASLFIDEQNKEGIITAIKHFPGHGSSTQDSHQGLTDITETWSEDELIPYKQIFEYGYSDIVLVGHLINKNIDKHYPASLSKIFINDLLRKQLGWNGVVITDDMHMGAITKYYGDTEALIMAINAGVDMLIVTKNTSKKMIEKTIDALEMAVKSGTIDISRINEAYQRINILSEKIK